MEVELMDMLEFLESRSFHKSGDDSILNKKSNSISNSDSLNANSVDNLNSCLKEKLDQFSNQLQQENTADFRNCDNLNSISNSADLNFDEMNTASQVTPFAATFQLSNLIAQNPLIKSFIFGSFSGTCSTLLFQPFDLLKTRQQNPQIKSQNFLRLSLKIIQDEKPISLWRGTVPSLIRSVPGIGLYFCSLNALERAFCKQDSNGNRIRPNAIEAALFGLTARVSVGALLMPATVIKTRLESGLFDYNNVKKAFSTIRRIEGVRGLYTGASATLLRDAPYSSIYYMFYSELRKLTSANGNKEQQNTLVSQSAQSFLCGLVAGLAASALTQPPDVIKTHMQLRPDKYPNVKVTTLAIFNEHGINGLFRGIVPRMIRRTLMSSLAWTVYEAFAQHYNLK